MVFKRTLVSGVTPEPPGSRLLPYGLVFGCRSGHEGLLLGHSMRSIQGLLPPTTARHLKLMAWVLRTNGQLMMARWWRSKYLPVPLAEYEVPPDRPADDLVLYQTRIWEPAAGGISDERRAVNEARADTVRALRRAFGDRFVGGLVPSPYASATYPDCLSPLPTVRESYLQIMHRCAVVVSTTGLHGSVPFKIPEYLAASPVIVTEPITARLPRPMEDGHHLVTLTSPEDCVDKCGRILADAAHRSALRRGAAEYYRREVRPDELVRNRLQDLRTTQARLA